MKYMFASDIHGSAYFCRKTLEAYKKSGAARLILLGDILYHGPRNEFPKEYEPKQVLSMLNEYRNEIYAVRGNCDSEVDQMVLEFPMMADYALLVLNGRTFYATHGHIYNKEVLPPMQPGDVLIHGHIHLPVAEPMGDGYLLNPGSVSLPKGGSPNSYGILDEHVFTIYDFEGSKVKEIAL
ncbi:MAG: phosphodiesterase [Hungatella sp.]|jgi:putative phosphoesterase|nr:phosphodiesterase [Hungatella sp.]